MKHLKSFKKLFESFDYEPQENQQEESGFIWNMDSIKEVLSNYASAEFPYMPTGNEESDVYNSSTFRNMVRLISDYQYFSKKNIERSEWANLLAYICRWGRKEINIANWMFQNLIMLMPHLNTRGYVRMTIIFSDMYFKQAEQRTEISMKMSGILDKDEDMDDLRAEVIGLIGDYPTPEEMETINNPKRDENIILKGRELEDAINAALERGDFEEVARLSKMLESVAYQPENYVNTKKDIKTLYKEFIEAIKKNFIR